MEANHLSIGDRDLEAICLLNLTDKDEAREEGCDCIGEGVIGDVLGKLSFLTHDYNLIAFSSFQTCGTLTKLTRMSLLIFVVVPVSLFPPMARCQVESLTKVVVEADWHGNTLRINIWEQRKVFGSHESLKQDMLTKNIDTRNRNGKGISYKLKQPGGEQLQKLISAYSDASGFPFDEETLLESCQAAVSFVECFEKDTWNQRSFHGSVTVKELLKYHEVLSDSIKKLKDVESTRAILVACLKEALLEQETKYSQVCQQLKAAQSGYQLSVNLCNRVNIDISPDRRLLESPDHGPPGFSNTYAFEYVEGNQTAGNSTSSTLEAAPGAPQLVASTSSTFEAAPGAPQLVASTSSTFEAAPGAPQLADLTISTQMQDYAQRFVCSNDIVGPTIEEDLQSNNKRSKLEDDLRYSFQRQPQFLPPFPPLHPNALNQPPSQPPIAVTYPDSTVELLPPPPSTPFPPPPPPPPPPPVAPVAPAFTPLADLTIASTYGYATAPPFPNYQMVGFPTYPAAGNQYGFLQASEGSNYGSQPPFPRLPPPPPPPPLA